MGKLVFAFDIYGTLLDTSAIASAIGKQLGLADGLVQSKPSEIATSWRKYQLEFVVSFEFCTVCPHGPLEDTPGA